MIHRIKELEYKPGERRTINIYEDGFFKNLKTFPVHDAGLKGWNDIKQSHFDSGDKTIKAFLNELLKGGQRDDPENHRHYYEAIIYCIAGNGVEVVRRCKKDAPHQFSWQEGSIFSPPLNWYHDHLVTSDMPGRYIAFVNAPLGRWLLTQEYAYYASLQNKPVKIYTRNLPYSPTDSVSKTSGKSFDLPPVTLKGVHIDHINQMPLVRSWWPLRGCNAYGLDLSENRTISGMILEIDEGAGAKSWRDYCERFVYVLAGEGKTEIWREGASCVEYRWESNDLFNIPSNHWYLHTNSSDDQPARLLEVSNAPLMERIMDRGFVYKELG